MDIKMALIDDDYVVRAKTNLVRNNQDDRLGKFLKKIKEELLPGQTAYLEIKDSQTDPITFEITQA
ncbi:hypothetical protein ACFLYZ_00905 [Thermodesulfobacteriota bacterium]